MPPTNANGPTARHPEAPATEPQVMERAVLGAMLREPRCVPDVTLTLTWADFQFDAHQRFFRIITGMVNERKPVDLASLADELLRRGELDDVGGYPAIAKLWETSASPANVGYYAKQVRQYSLFRQLALAGYEITRDAENPTGDAETCVGNAERRIFALSRAASDGKVHHLSDTLNEVFDRIDARQLAGTSLGVETGIPSLDCFTSGFQKSELVILAARPSVGKSAFALTVALNAAVKKCGVLFLSIEQAHVELGERAVCADAGVNAHVMRTRDLSNEEVKRLHASRNTLSPLPISIDDQSHQTMSRIASQARRLSMREKIGLVIVDYLQLITPEDRRAPRHEQIGEITRRLKNLARELDIPLLVLAQLNRDVENRGGRPKLSDLKASGDIEQDADQVILLHRPAKEPGLGEDVLEVIVAKHRNGPTGETKLKFEKQYQRFTDLGETPY